MYLAQMAEPFALFEEVAVHPGLQILKSDDTVKCARGSNAAEAGKLGPDWSWQQPCYPVHYASTPQFEQSSANLLTLDNGYSANFDLTSLDLENRV